MCTMAHVYITLLYFRGVYLASMIYSLEGRVLVTMDDHIPTVEVSDIRPSSIGTDFAWLAKVCCLPILSLCLSIFPPPPSRLSLSLCVWCRWLVHGRMCVRCMRCQSTTPPRLLFSSETGYSMPFWSYRWIHLQVAHMFQREILTISHCIIPNHKHGVQVYACTGTGVCMYRYRCTHVHVWYCKFLLVCNKWFWYVALVRMDLVCQILDYCIESHIKTPTEPLCL